jgi:hypothetical protein
MNIGQLKKVLNAASKQYREAGNAGFADGLSDLASNLLDGKDNETVAAFVKRVERARNPTPPKSRAPRKRK